MAPKPASGSVALDRVVAQPPRAARRRARSRPSPSVRDHDEADAGVVGEGGDQLGVERVDLVPGHPVLAARAGRSGRGRPRRGRRPRAPTGRSFSSSIASSLGAEHDLAVDHLVARSRARACARPALSSSRASVIAPPTVVIPSSAAGGAKTSPPADRASGPRSSSVCAVALAERPPLGLAVVGEHDEVVRARRLLDRALEPGELRVVLPQDRERVGLLDPGVVGDLVVADEGRVDDGDALDDVAHQAGDVQVAHDDRDRAAHPRVEAAAVDVLRAGPALAAGGPPLQEHVPEVEGDRPGEPVGVGEVGEVLARRRSAAGRGSRSSSPSSGARRRRTGCRGWRRPRPAGRRRRSGGARSRSRPCRGSRPSSCRLSFSYQRKAGMS